jgi:hypothetical protein
LFRRSDAIFEFNHKILKLGFQSRKVIVNVVWVNVPSPTLGFRFGKRLSGGFQTTFDALHVVCYQVAATNRFLQSAFNV